jgi:hypothetical protein
MTPKEKAEELVKNFKKNTRAFNETNGWEDSSYDAKQCALICVYEILIVLENERVFESIDYWEEVKKEIELL